MELRYENTEARYLEEKSADLPESSASRLVSTQVFDALDLRLMDTFPASDAVAQY